MPRRARIIIENKPHHILQRGHNLNAVFTDDEDYLFYIENLKSLKKEYNVCVYAYCLLENHVHLILNPCSDAGSIAVLMKRLAARHTRFINSKYNRRGTSWESRYRSSPIDKKHYLLACCRYIEKKSEQFLDGAGYAGYRWSSYKYRFASRYSWLDFPDCFAKLGFTTEQQKRAYDNYLNSPVPTGEWELIDQSIEKQQATGNRDFVKKIAVTCGEEFVERRRGRPRKTSPSVSRQI